MILGFGSTETENEQHEHSIIKDIVVKAVNGNERYSPSMVDEVRRKVRARADELHKIDRGYAKDGYKNAPQRYYHYYPHVLGDASYLVVIVSYMHMNTKHGLSPDGLALLQTEAVYHFYIDNLIKKEDS